MEKPFDLGLTWKPQLLNYFWRQGVPAADCEDLVQETYLKLWNYRERYVPTAKLLTFLLRLARQVRLDALKRDTRRKVREENWVSEREDSVCPTQKRCDAREDVRWALARLPEDYREVVELGVFQDLPYAEIAEILEIPLGTVKSRMFHAIRKLKEFFDDARSGRDTE